MVGVPSHIVGMILAHQGGWDELLIVFGPMAVIVLVALLVKRWVEAGATAAAEAADHEPGTHQLPSNDSHGLERADREPPEDEPAERAPVDR